MSVWTLVTLRIVKLDYLESPQYLLLNYSLLIFQSKRFPQWREIVPALHFFRFYSIRNDLLEWFASVYNSTLYETNCQIPGPWQPSMVTQFIIHVFVFLNQILFDSKPCLVKFLGRCCLILTSVGHGCVRNGKWLLRLNFLPSLPVLNKYFFSFFFFTRDYIDLIVIT